jgi:tetratricopeptide (TPR) repeat protein
MIPADSGSVRVPVAPRVDARTPRGGWRIGIAILGLGLLQATMPCASAHGALHQQLVDVSSQLAEHPDDFDLLLRRGELYRLHESWADSRADFEKARTLRPDELEPIFRLGRLELDAENATGAAHWLERTLERKPHHIEAALLMGRAQAKLGKTEAAVEHFTTAIHWSRQPRPEWFLERSKAILAGAKSSTDREALKRATASLDEGLELVGPVPSLQLAAIELDLRAGYVDVALTRLDSIRTSSERKETWWFRRGIILEEAGRSREALQAFEATLAAIESLPDRLQRTLAMVQLRKDLEPHLTRLRARSEAASKP